MASTLTVSFYNLALVTKSKDKCEILFPSKKHHTSLFINKQRIPLTNGAKVEFLRNGTPLTGDVEIVPTSNDDPQLPDFTPGPRLPEVNAILNSRPDAPVTLKNDLEGLLNARVSLAGGRLQAMAPVIPALPPDLHPTVRERAKGQFSKGVTDEAMQEWDFDSATSQYAHRLTNRLDWILEIAPGDTMKVSVVTPEREGHGKGNKVEYEIPDEAEVMIHTDEDSVDEYGLRPSKDFTQINDVDYIYDLLDGVQSRPVATRNIPHQCWEVVICPLILLIILL